MASQGWRPLRASRLFKVACAIGLAIGWITVLFLCVGRGAPALSASTDSDGDRASAWVEVGEIGPTWTSTQPEYIQVGRDYKVWALEHHPVTVTFYPGSVSADAWFTFTPRISSSLGGAYAPTPYFFDLEGVYKENDLQVSLGTLGIQIELSYDPVQLTGMDERSLQFFHHAPTEWVPQGGDVDLTANKLTLRTKRTESFAVGGSPPKKYIYLSLVMRE